MIRYTLIAGAFCFISLVARADTPLDHGDALPDDAEPPLHANVTTDTDAPGSPDASLDRLRDGNSRYVLGESTFPRTDASRRYETVSDGQHPFATILSCADSRVPPELIFDAGIGDLFVIRVAGNVADVDEIASIEYGTEHLNTPVVVVMGHTACGAVTAVANGTELHGHLAELTNNILPAVTDAKRENPKLTGERLITQSIRWNVRQAQADLIGNSETIRGLVGSGKLKVVGAIYDLHSGSVLWLGEHPDQPSLLDPSYVSRSLDHFAAPVLEKKSTLSSPTPHTKPIAPPSALAASNAHSESASDDSHAPEGDLHAETQTTKAERHGLMVPAMFMLGGVALSSTLVFVIRSRRPLPSTSTNNRH